MNHITSALHHTLQKIFDIHGNIELIIAYSGGIDSQVLLHALVQLRHKRLISNEITVCHVNHGLSKNADSWQTLAEQECIKLSVNLVVKRVNVQEKAQQSLEALARDARYSALKSLREKKSIVLTGHHSDDQSETFLLALKRGAGLKGLSAMSEQIQLGQHVLVRPLLSISRQEIEEYANIHQLQWVEDESNFDTCFDRNFIRQEIMPLLRQRWPSINSTINRSASHCLSGQALLDELGAQDLVLCKASDMCLHVDVLISLSPARFNNLIRFFMAQYHYLMPSTEQLLQLRQQLQAGEDKSPQVKVAEHVFRRFKNTLFLTSEFSDISDWHQQVILFNGTGLIDKKVMILPDNLGKLIFNTNTVTSSDTSTKLPHISLPEYGQQVSVRFRHENPKCLPHFRQHSRTVKKVLQELNIAPWQRKRIAFLYYDDELVSAIGYFICQAFVESNPELGMQIHQTK